MAIYIIFFLFLLFFSFTEQITGKKIIPLRVFVVIFLALFAGLRPLGASNDTESYAYDFTLFVAPTDYFKNFSDWNYFEPLFYLIPSFYKTYLKPFDYTSLTFLTIAFIAVPIKLLNISRLSKYFFISVLVYFSNFYFLQEMIQIRAGVATAAVLMAIYFIEKKNYLVVILIIFISSLFHYSSLIIIAFIFFDPKKINIKFYLLLLLLTFILMFVNFTFVSKILNIDLGFLTLRSLNYIELNERGLSTGINKLNSLFLISFATTAFLISKANVLIKQNKYSFILLKMQVWGLFIFQFFSEIPILSFRLSDLLLVTQIITLPFLIISFRNKWVGFVCIVVIAFFYLWINLFYSNTIRPYFN